jgi:hypothetical protein
MTERPRSRKHCPRRRTEDDGGNIYHRRYRRLTSTASHLLFNSILAVVSLPPCPTIAVFVERHRTSPIPSNAIIHLPSPPRPCHLDLIVASLFAPTASLSSITVAIGRCRRHQTPLPIARSCTTRQRTRNCTRQACAWG